MRQNRKILAHIKYMGYIDPITALKQYGCFRLAARIKDLRLDMCWSQRSKNRIYHLLAFRLISWQNLKYNMAKHLKYCMMYGMLEGQIAPKGHPQLIMKELGIKYQHATPQSMGDSWWFWNCENLPDPLPPYLTVKDWNPMEMIGFGLDEKSVEKIRDYESSSK